MLVCLECVAAFFRKEEGEIVRCENVTWQLSWQPFCFHWWQAFVFSVSENPPGGQEEVSHLVMPALQSCTRGE